MKLLCSALVALAAAGCGDSANHEGRDGGGPPPVGGNGSDMGSPGLPGRPGISVGAPSAVYTTEAGGEVALTLVLNTSPVADVTIPIVSTRAGEGRVDLDRVVFTKDDWGTPQKVVVTGVDDALPDGDQTYMLVLGAALSSDPDYAGIDPSDLTLVNRDNDTPGFTVTPTSGLVTRENGASATFKVRLNTRPTAPVTMGVVSDAPSEGMATPAQLVFAPDEWETPQTVTVTGADETVADGDRRYTIVLTVVNTADPNYKVLDPDDVTVTNMDDDTPGIAVTVDGDPVTRESDWWSLSVKVVLRSQPTADVVVPLSSDNPREGAVSPASITFTPADWSTERTVSIKPVNDDVHDRDQHYHVVVGAAVSDDPRYQGISQQLEVVNRDDDEAGLIVDNDLVTDESGREAAFVVRLRSKPTASVTVRFTSTNAAEGTLTVAQATIQPSAWSTGATLRVRGVADDVADGDVNYRLHPESATSSDADYNGIQVDDVRVTNLDWSSHYLQPRVVTATNNMFLRQISGDGRWLLYSVQNGQTQLYDTVRGTATTVSMSSGGSFGNASSWGGGVSADGQVVAFTSSATNLVPGDTNGKSDVFVRDLAAGTTTRINLAPDGAQADADGAGVSLSADGRFVVYDSSATNLVAGDANKSEDVFVFDRTSGKTTRVSVDSKGNEANHWSDDPAISADGRYIAFISAASNLWPGDGDSNDFDTDIFVHDVQTGETTCASLNADGAPAGGSVSNLMISSEGRYVGWGDGPLYIFDRTTGMRDYADRVNGQPLPFASSDGNLSADGRQSIVRVHNSSSFVDNLWTIDLDAGRAILYTPTERSVFDQLISNGGKTLVYSAMTTTSPFNLYVTILTRK